MIKKNYERKYSNSLSKADKKKRKSSNGTNESLAINDETSIADMAKRAKTKKILETEDLSNLPNEQKLIKFISIYKEKIKIIDDFFNIKLKEYISEYEKLENKINSMEEQMQDESFLAEINAERDEMGYAVSWKRALSSLYIETSWLHSYHSINILAVQKNSKENYKNI
jgi:hypothetical protein